jgi:hypothetical protein
MQQKLNTELHTDMPIYVPYIHKVLRMRVGCGISHKNAKHVDRYKKEYGQIYIQNTVKISPTKRFHTK